MAYRDPEKGREADRRYYLAHRERIKARQLAYYYRTSDPTRRRVLRFRLRLKYTVNGLRADARRVDRLLSTVRLLLEDEPVTCADFLHLQFRLRPFSAAFLRRLSRR